MCGVRSCHCVASCAGVAAAIHCHVSMFASLPFGFAAEQRVSAFVNIIAHAKPVASGDRFCHDVILQLVVGEGARPSQTIFNHQLIRIAKPVASGDRFCCDVIGQQNLSPLATGFAPFSLLPAWPCFEWLCSGCLPFSPSHALFISIVAVACFLVCKPCSLVQCCVVPLNLWV